MAQKTALDKLNTAIVKIINEYAETVQADLGEIANKIGNAGVTALRAKSRETFPRGTGEYAKGWKKKVDVTRTSVSVTIYNVIPSLPHLLENGHATRNGTGRTFRRTPGHPHIAPVEAELVQAFEKEVISRL